MHANLLRVRIVTCFQTVFGGVVLRVLGRCYRSGHARVTPFPIASPFSA